MFYESKPQAALRFGDIVRGYVLSAPQIDSPGTSPPVEYRLAVLSPTFAVIMSPCCSIRDRTLAISPLIEILPLFLRNPYFANDLTNINRRMPGEKALSPGRWAKLSAEEKQARMAAGDAYALLEYFIYAPHDLLPPYTVKDDKDEEGREVGHYMIDFRKICRIECNKIVTPEQAPLETKVLQIAVDTRSELSHFSERSMRPWIERRSGPRDFAYVRAMGRTWLLFVGSTDAAATRPRHPGNSDGSCRDTRLVR